MSFGGKYMLSRSVGLDFAATGGKFEGSPRLGGAFGVSIDFLAVAKSHNDGGALAFTFMSY